MVERVWEKTIGCYITNELMEIDHMHEPDEWEYSVSSSNFVVLQRYLICGGVYVKI
jgi:hypothetical protein